MPRRRLYSKPITRWIRRAKHVSDSGIYCDPVGGIIEKYTHDFKLVNFYLTVSCLTGIHASADGGLSTYTSTELYSTVDGGNRLIWQLTVNPHIAISHWLFHPIRNVFLMATSGLLEGSMFEVVPGRPCFKRQIDGPSYPIRLVPSNYSTLIYSTHCLQRGIHVHVTGMATLNYLIDPTGLNHTLMMRPDHPEVLTSANGHSIALLDMWHASSRGPLTYRITKSTGNFIRSVHINSNTCIVYNDTKLYVIDYRWGLVQTITGLGYIGGMWYVDNVARIYLDRSEDHVLYTIDV